MTKEDEARALEVGPGFVSARSCPDCLHTRCGEDCVCNCDAAVAEFKAAELRSENERLRAQVATLTAERDEQAARIAALTKGVCASDDCDDKGPPCGHCKEHCIRCEWEEDHRAAIRARAGSPECCGNIGCINWDRPPGYAGTNGPCRCPRPVAPGEVKP